MWGLGYFISKANGYRSCQPNPTVKGEAHPKASLSRRRVTLLMLGLVPDHGYPADRTDVQWDIRGRVTCFAGLLTQTPQGNVSLAARLRCLCGYPTSASVLAAGLLRYFTL